VEQNYQTIDAAVTAMAVPEAVSVALAEVVADVREGLLAMAVGAGLQVMAAMMAADVTAVCGPKGKHNPDRKACAARRREGVGCSRWPAGAGRAAADARGRRCR
jgi:putative transposase